MCVQTLAEKAEKHTKIWGGEIHVSAARHNNF